MGRSDADAWTVEEVTVEVVRPLRHAVMRPSEPEDAVVFRSDAQEDAVHLAVRCDEGNVVGVASFHGENRVAGQPPHRHPGVRIRAVAVDPAFRDKGVAPALLTEALARIRQSGALEAWANARMDRLDRYEAHGFRALSSAFEIPGLGTYVVTARAIKPKKSKAKAKGSDAAADEEE